LLFQTNKLNLYEITINSNISNISNISNLVIYCKDEQEETNHLS